MAKDRTGLGDIASEALLTGAVSGTIGSAFAGVGAAPAALAGLGFGFLSGVARAAAEEINDAINDIDNLPNQVEDLLEQDANLRKKNRVTPEEIANNVRTTINSTDQIRENLLTDVQSMDEELKNLKQFRWEFLGFNTGHGFIQYLPIIKGKSLVELPLCDTY